jgi:transglutaminase-like putative cysteine protease
MWWWQVLDPSSEGWLGRFREYRKQDAIHNESESSREALQSRGIPDPTGNGGERPDAVEGEQTARRGRRKVHEGCFSGVVDTSEGSVSSTPGGQPATVKARGAR